MSKLNKEQQEVFDQKLEAALKTAKAANGGKDLTKEQEAEVAKTLMAEFDESPVAKKARLEKEKTDKLAFEEKQKMNKKRIDAMMPHDKHNPYEPPKV
jgi:hypothetical protein